MPGNHRLLRAGEEIEALVETFYERRRTHGPHSCRRELERQRKPVEMADDVDYVSHVVRSEGESSPGSDGTFDEEARCWSFRCCRRTDTFVGNREGPDPPHLLARKSERAAAGSKDGQVRTPAEETAGERR